MNAKPVELPTMIVGFIGLGRMGGGMARRLLHHGRTVVGYDVDEKALATFADAGGKVAESPRDVADQAEIVFGSLPTLSASKEVTLGDEGIVHGKNIRIFVETSTVGPHELRKLSDQLKAADIAVVDSPVSGAPQGAADGTLTTATCGPRDAVEDVLPYLQDMAQHIFRVGDEPGIGQLFKVVNNYIVMSSLAITCEAVAIGVRAGAAEASLVDFIDHATGRNFATKTYFPTIILPKASVRPLTMSLKDVSLFAEQASALGSPSQAAQALLDKWQSADMRGETLVDWYNGMKDAGT